MHLAQFPHEILAELHQGNFYRLHMGYLDSSILVTDTSTTLTTLTATKCSNHTATIWATSTVTCTATTQAKYTVSTCTTNTSTTVPELQFLHIKTGPAAGMVQGNGMGCVVESVPAEELVKDNGPCV